MHLALTDSDWKLQRELAELDASLAKVQQSIADANARMQAHEVYMAEHFAREIAEAKALVAEFEALNLAKLLREQGGAQARGSEHQAGPAQRAPKPNRQAAGALKKLYLVIAVRCHPDKTNDPILHGLFHAAAAALASNDMGQMQAIYDALRDRPKATKLSAFDLRISRLKAKLAQRRQELEAAFHAANALANSAQIQHVEAVEQMKATAGHAAYIEMQRQVFKLKNDEFRRRIRQLREPPAVAPWNIYSTGSTNYRFVFNVST